MRMCDQFKVKAPPVCKTIDSRAQKTKKRSSSKKISTLPKIIVTDKEQAKEILHDRMKKRNVILRRLMQKCEESTNHKGKSVYFNYKHYNHYLIVSKYIQQL